MKKIFWVVILAVMTGLSGCAGPVIKKNGEVPKIEVFFIKEIKIFKFGEILSKDEEKGTTTYRLVEKDDEDGRKLMMAFRKEFSEELSKRGIKVVVERAEVSARIDMLYRTQFAIPLPVRFLEARVVFYNRQEEKILEVARAFQYGVLPPVDYAVPKLAAALADAVLLARGK